MKLIAYPVKDAHFDKYRVLVMQLDNAAQTATPIIAPDIFDTREEAQTAAYAVTGLFQVHLGKNND